MKIWVYNAETVSLFVNSCELVLPKSHTIENQKCNENFTFPIEQYTKYYLGWPLIYKDIWRVYPWWAATVWWFSKINAVYRFVMLILAVMHIGKGQNMFYIWFDGKHIPLFHLSFIAGCSQINKKYFPNFSPQRMQFQATTLKMWVNTMINQWENQLNWIVTKRKFYTRTYSLWSLFWYWGNI